MTATREITLQDALNEIQRLTVANMSFEAKLAQVREIIDNVQEIHPDNYDHSQVMAMNEAHNQIFGLVYHDRRVKKVVPVRKGQYLTLGPGDGLEEGDTIIILKGQQ